MKNYLKLHNSLLWGIIACLFGGLLLYWQREFLYTVIMIMGGIALAMGVIQLISFLVKTKGVDKRWNQFPLSIVITLIIGILLLVNAPQWVEVFITIMGIIMILLTLPQIGSLVTMKKLKLKFPALFVIFPILQIIAGGLIIAYPNNTADWLVIFCGCWIILYGIIEIASFFHFNQQIKTVEVVEVK